MRNIASILFAGLLVLGPAVVSAQDMEYVGSTLWSDPWDLVVRDSLVYCSYQAGLVILDCSSLSRPAFVSKLYLPGEGRHLALSGNYIYLADRYCGLEIIDISDPANPTLVGEYDDHFIEDVFIDGQFAYIVGYSNSSVIDISDPSQPSLIGDYYEGSSDYSSVWVAGNYAYITASGYGSALIILDISDPAHPGYVGGYGSYTVYFDVWVRDNYAYIAKIGGGNDPGFLILDVSNPSNPTLAGQYLNSGSEDIFILGNKAFIGSGGGFGILNITDPTNPTLWYRYTNAMGGTGLFAVGGYVYFAAGPSDIQIVNVVDEPFNVGYYSTPYWSQGIIVRDNYAYIASGSHGLRTVNITNPQDPIAAGHFPSPWPATSLFVDSNYAYMVIGDQGIQIINVTNPALPRGTGVFDTPGTARDIFVDSDYAYIVDGELRIVNISNPSRPSSCQ